MEVCPEFADLLCSSVYFGYEGQTMFLRSHAFINMESQKHQGRRWGHMVSTQNQIVYNPFPQNSSVFSGLIIRPRFAKCASIEL